MGNQAEISTIFLLYNGTISMNRSCFVDNQGLYSVFSDKISMIELGTNNFGINSQTNLSYCVGYNNLVGGCEPFLSSSCKALYPPETNSNSTNETYSNINSTMMEIRNCIPNEKGEKIDCLKENFFFSNVFVRSVFISVCVLIFCTLAFNSYRRHKKIHHNGYTSTQDVGNGTGSQTKRRFLFKKKVSDQSLESIYCIEDEEDDDEYKI